MVWPNIIKNSHSGQGRSDHTTDHNSENGDRVVKILSVTFFGIGIALLVGGAILIYMGVEEYARGESLTGIQHIGMGGLIACVSILPIYAYIEDVVPGISKLKQRINLSTRAKAVLTVVGNTLMIVIGFAALGLAMFTLYNYVGAILSKYSDVVGVVASAYVGAIFAMPMGILLSLTYDCIRDIAQALKTLRAGGTEQK